MSVLVTGGSGFLGRSVLELLARRDEHVLALARSQQAATMVADRGAVPIRGDLDDVDGLRQALAGQRVDRVVHLASMGFGHAPVMVDLVRWVEASRSVFVSTTSVFTKLDAPSKRVRVAAERRVADAGLAAVMVRPTMIYGRVGDRNIERLVAGLERWPAFPVVGGDALHQPVHVDDLAATVVASVAADAPIGAFNVPGPVALSFHELVATVVRVLGRRRVLFPAPVSPLAAGLRLVERSGRRLPVTGEQMERLREDKAFDVGPAVERLGHRPRPFADGVVALLESRRADARQAVR